MTCSLFVKKKWEHRLASSSTGVESACVDELVTCYSLHHHACVVCVQKNSDPTPPGFQYPTNIWSQIFSEEVKCVAVCLGPVWSVIFYVMPGFQVDF